MQRWTLRSTGEEYPTSADKSQEDNYSMRGYSLQQKMDLEWLPLKTDKVQRVTQDAC
jgi:hypothetical protein